MKAAFLDFATVGSDELDVTPLKDATAEFSLFDNTSDNEVASRI